MPVKSGRFEEISRFSGAAVMTTALQIPQCVWMVSREYEGIAGAGGVKDVCRQLAETLVSYGKCAVSVVLP